MSGLYAWNAARHFNVTVGDVLYARDHRHLRLSNDAYRHLLEFVFLVHQKWFSLVPPERWILLPVFCARDGTALSARRWREIWKEACRLELSYTVSLRRARETEATLRNHANNTNLSRLFMHGPMGRPVRHSARLDHWSTV